MCRLQKRHKNHLAFAQSNTLEKEDNHLGTTMTAPSSDPNHPIASFHSVMSHPDRDSSEYETLSFPLKLHAMLTDAADLGFQHIVSWQSDEKCFKVQRVDEFTSTTMRKYFKQTKYKSFQRQ